MKNKKIGILFIFKSRWLGGLYYLINIIKACSYLPKDEQPEIVVFYNERTKKYLNEIEYSKIEFIQIELDFDLKRYIKSFFFQKNFYFIDTFRNYNLDVLFPFNDFIGSTTSGNIKLISWIPDFQHKFFPQYFSKLNLLLRELKFKNIVRCSNGLVLSSQSAVDHFYKFYHPKSTFKTHIVRFTSIFDKNSLPEEKSLLQDYKIDFQYFIVSNQFYAHKNHLIVLKALKNLLDKGTNAHVVFTGRPNKSEDMALLKEIDDCININNLSDQIHLLGLLPREEQLALMKYSIAVIQPSKFEGWSTVIEDAKTLDKIVIASNLDVHKEQLGDYGYFFDVDSDTELSICMNSILKNNTNNIEYGSLEARTEKFARDFIHALL